jgi:plasmid stability protein
MAQLSKRSTIYFDPDIHQALRLKAASTHKSVSELVDDALRLLMTEDEEDLSAVRDRIKEPEVTYEVLLKDLKANGKL